ncbi:serine/threonine protein kinase [Pendulispora brunnea]|uniref:Serine/threonine protein kinase n=1 Tax=Pendulispora brunnea TaxID=2905690 RepID=A0ABZ2KMT5_9BACT
MTSDPDDPFAWIGHALEGRYDVEKVVGEGGFAVVYRGHHKGLDDAVAIKCLKIPRKLAGEERERFLQSFLDEGKLLHRLSRANANIVQALDVGATTSPNGTWTPYLVLEWLDGESLEDDLRARSKKDLPPRSLEETLALLEPAARALATAHAQGIAHRDIKPANLFLCTVAGKRIIKVVDFGIAKVIGESTDLQRAHEATGMSLHAFTPRYGAPEQFDRRFGATGPWTDVFALALIVVEMTAGHSAMQGDSAQLFVASSNVQHRPTLRALDIDVGTAADAVEQVLLRALAVDPKERYASAGDFWDALVLAAKGATLVDPLPEAPAAARTRAPVDPLAATVASLRVPDTTRVDVHKPEPSISTAMASVDVPARPAPRKGNPFLWIALAGTAALGVVWFAFRSPADSPPARAATPVASSSAAPPKPSAPPPVASASAAPIMAPAPATPAPSAPMACSSGLVPYVDTNVGYSLCIPNEFRDIVAVDGAIRKGELELTMRGGYLQAGTSLDSMFEHDKADEPETGRTILPAKTEKTANAFSLAGTVHGKSFFQRTVTTTDRFATFQLVYPTADRKTIEPKLEHMMPTFIIGSKTSR